MILTQCLLGALNGWFQFNQNKAKLLSINRSRSSENISILMSGQPLPESPLVKLLGLTFSTDLSRKEYIISIAKSASKKVGSLYRARNYLSPECILYLYKSLIRPAMEYCCHIWPGSPANSLSLLDKIQKRVINIIGPTLAAKLQPLSLRRDVASLSLFYKYYHGHCSKELSSLVPGALVHTRLTRHSLRSHPFSVAIPFSKKRRYTRSFFPRTSKLWNSLPSSCFPKSYNLQHFKSSANRYLVSKLSSL